MDATKQRPLTDKQRKLLELDAAGATDEVIAAELAIHPGTVRAKRAALRRGIAKGAYSDLPAMPASGDLFSGAV